MSTALIVGHAPFPGHLRVDGVVIHPAESQSLRNHSPDGFSWGYGGSGPAQTALAILLHVSEDPELAQRHYQAFKFEFVAAWPQESFTAEIDVEAWLAAREAERDTNGLPRENAS